MKPCLLCSTQCPDDAATCPACGEGTFGEPVQAESPEDDKPKAKPPGKPKAR
jgi:hypothetical protein